MKIDTLALWIIVSGAVLFGIAYLGIALVATAGVAPWLPIVILVILAPTGYILYRVVVDRLSNAEDDRYERDVHQ